MKKYYFIVFLMLILVVAAACGNQVFDGSRTGNDEQFLLDYYVLNCTKTHEINLEKGTTVNVEIENKSGHVDILVSDTEGEEIYRGDNEKSGKFSITIPNKDIYEFSVTGKNAKGSVHFRVAD